MVALATRSSSGQDPSPRTPGRVSAACPRRPAVRDDHAPQPRAFSSSEKWPSRSTNLRARGRQALSGASVAGSARLMSLAGPRHVTGGKPLAIRSFSAVAGRVSIAPRLALRDLARYQARSGAALAAVTLAL